MKVIIFFGPPCSGKGTHSKLLSNEFNINVIDTGSMIRKEGEMKTEFGLISKKLIDEGNYVPNDLLIPKMREWIDELKTSSGLIFDGYPRTLEQFEDLNKHIQIDHFIHLDCPVPVLQERVVERGKTSGRSDDNLEYFPTRINNYNIRTKPIIEHYPDKIIKVNTNNPIDVVYQQIKMVINFS